MPAAGAIPLDSRWRAAAAEHRAAVEAYLETARELPAASWDRPWAAAKWTPAEITEHLSLTCEALLAELREGRPMHLRLSPWKRRLARWLVLPHILFHGSFPVRAAAPRETRPTAPRAGRDRALETLARLSEQVEEALEHACRSGAGVTHPYFGRIDALRGLRFVAVHLEHHRRQVARAAR